MDELRVIHQTPWGRRLADRELPVGLVVAEILAELGLDPDDPAWAVSVDGRTVPREAWLTVQPPAGVPVHVIEVPAQGQGAKVGRIVATVVLVALTWYVGGAVGAAYGAGAGAAAAAAVSVAGGLLINALIPAPTSRVGAAAQGQISNTYSWAGARNEARPWGVVPRVFGRHRLFPPYAALPYVETAAGEQYVNLLLDCGPGPLELSQLRIADTALEQFEGVEVELREGRSGDKKLSLFRTTVNATAVGTVLSSGVEHTFTTEADTDEIGLEFTFAGLVEFDAGTGERLERQVSIEVGYRENGTAGPWLTAGVLGRSGETVSTAAKFEDTGGTQSWRTASRVTGDRVGFTLGAFPGSVGRVFVRRRPYGGDANDWTLVAGFKVPGAVTVPALKGIQNEFHLTAEELKVVFGDTDYTVWQVASDCPDPSAWSYETEDGAGAGVTFADARETAVFRALRIKPGAAKRWDVRLERITPDAVGVNVRDELTLRELHSIRWRNPSAALIGSHALIALRVRATDQLHGALDQVNVVAQALLPVWDGEDWTDPVATSAPAWAVAAILREAERPVSYGEIDGDALAEWSGWCVQQGMEFNAVLDWPSTVYEAAKLAAAAGRASLANQDGKYTITRDEAQTVPVQHITPRNSWGFSAERQLAEPLHGLRVRYLSEEADWAWAERIVYADGYDEETATRLETIEFPGVTGEDQIWKLGRYHLAVIALRRESYSVSMDWEHLVCTRGDLVRLSYDVPLFGVQAARITAVVVDGGGLVETITLDELLELAEATTYGVRIRRADGTSVTSDVTTEAGETNTLDLATPLSGVAVGDLVLFGLSGEESVLCRVASLQPGPNLSAVLRLVDDAPGVLTADTGPIPAFDPQITVPPVLMRPAPFPPVITEAVGVRVVEVDGSVRGELVLVLELTNRDGVEERWVDVQYRLDAAQRWEPRPPVAWAEAHVVRVTGVETGQAYRVRVRVVSDRSVASPWTETGTVVVAYVDEDAPATPTGLAAVFGTRVTWTWTRNTEPDFSHYETRLDAGSWNRSTAHALELVDPTARSYALEVRAVDRSGNVSDPTEASTATVDVPGTPTVGNLVASVEWNVVRLAVGASQARSSAHKGWVFEYGWNGTIWNDVNPEPAAEAVLVIPKGSISPNPRTLYLRYREVDVPGWNNPGLAQGGSSSSTTVNVTKPLVDDLDDAGDLAKLDQVNTPHVVQGAVTQQATATATTPLQVQTSWSDAISVSLAPGVDDSAVVVRCALVARVRCTVAYPVQYINAKLLRRRSGYSDVTLEQWTVSLTDLTYVSISNMVTDTKAVGFGKIDAPGTTDTITYVVQVSSGASDQFSYVDDRMIEAVELKR